MEQSDKRDFQSLLWALKPLINLSGFMPLPFVTTFLFVALDEGRGVNTYARAIGIHRSAMSRNLHALGDRARHGGPGLGLVTIDPPHRPRQKPGPFDRQGTPGHRAAPRWPRSDLCRPSVRQSICCVSTVWVARRESRRRCIPTRIRNFLRADRRAQPKSSMV